MSSTLRKVVYWAPRLLGIAFILFVASLSRSVFNEYLDAWQTFLTLLMRLVPSLIFAVVLLLAWKWEWVGALLFSTFAAYYAFENLKHPHWILAISAPLFLVGFLFLLSWFSRGSAAKMQQH